MHIYSESQAVTRRMLRDLQLHSQHRFATFSYRELFVSSSLTLQHQRLPALWWNKT